MATAIPLFESDLEEGEVFLEYVMETIASWASVAALNSDNALEAASTEAKKSPTERDEFTLDPYVPSVPTLRVDIPSRISEGKLSKEFLDKYSALVGQFATDGASFINTYLPPAVTLEPQVCTVLDKMLKGDPAFNETVVWERTRIQNDCSTTSAQDTASVYLGMNTFAQTIDLAALTYAAQLAEQIMNREQRLASIRLLLENLDYAAKAVGEMRQAAVNGMLDYISTYARAAQTAQSVALEVGVSKQPELISSVAQYRNALTSYEQLKAQARSTYNQLRVGLSDANLQISDSVKSLNQTALMNQAKSFAQQLSAAIGNINAGGSVSHLVR